jgi:hypothetical protein
MHGLNPPGLRASPRLAAAAALLGALIPAAALAQAVVETTAPPAAAAPAPQTFVVRPQPHPDVPFATAKEHYAWLKAQAHGGTKMTWAGLPDWGGVWTAWNGLGGGALPGVDRSDLTWHVASLTPKYTQTMVRKRQEVLAGVEWDRLSFCLPPGFPRWLTEPLSRDFILTPSVTLLNNEMVNDTRRIYTDGRDHPPADEMGHTWNGDSIGFWSGETLVIWTAGLKGGQYNRAQPDYSDKVETVEEWRRASPTIIEARVTIYDPESLAKPWPTLFRYTTVPDPAPRVRYWSCEENNNVVRTATGTTQFVLEGEAGYKDPDNLQATATGAKNAK